ncbi:MAG: transglutaminase-like cysteine peptidase [Alphaproteobacteria bacterium]
MATLTMVQTTCRTLPHDASSMIPSGCVPSRPVTTRPAAPRLLAGVFLCFLAPFWSSPSAQADPLPHPLARPFAAAEAPTAAIPRPHPLPTSLTRDRASGTSDDGVVWDHTPVDPALRSDASYGRLQLGDVRLPPQGWVTCFEARDPGCQFGAVELSQDRWRDLGRAQSLNRRWDYQADQGEDWRAPGSSLESGSERLTGDCEDTALAKLIFLKDRGWPEEALRIAVGKRDGIQHAALMVRTTLCDMILDNEGPVLCASKSRFRVEKINVGPFWRDARSSRLVPTLF